MDNHAIVLRQTKGESLFSFRPRELPSRTRRVLREFSSFGVRADRLINWKANIYMRVQNVDPRRIEIERTKEL